MYNAFFLCRRPTFDEVNWEHIYLDIAWETVAKVLCKRIKQTRSGLFLYAILADTRVS